MVEPLGAKDKNYQEGSKLLSRLIQEESRSLSGYERNQFFQNLGQGQFAEVGGVLGADLIQDGRGVAVGDLDADGDLDLLVSNRNLPRLVMLRNDTPAGNHYLAVKTVGVDSNRQGIGTRIRLTCDGRQQVREVQLGTGYVSQSSQTAWFGLGECSEVDSLELFWPSGQRQKFSSLAVDRTITVTEGSSDIGENRD